MTTEGRIDVTLELEAGRCARVVVASSRPLHVWRALEGRSVDEALKLLPLMSSICSSAQAVAGLRACEAALGVQVDPREEAAREAVVAAEVLQNHLWFWFVTGQDLIGAAPNLVSLRRVRARLAEATVAVMGKGPWLRLGGMERTPDVDALERALDAVDAELRAAGLASGAQSLEQLSAGAGPAAEILRVGFETSLRAVGQTSAPVESFDPAFVADAVWNVPGFERAPKGRRGPMELGPLVSTADDPLVRHAVASMGHGVGARLVARSVETCAKFEALRQTAQNLQPPSPRGQEARESGRGFGTAPTSRGPVLHAVDVEQRQVVGWRVVAPTEWTFHPEGPVREALVGLAAPDVQEATRWARWAVATLDPCVEFAVRARES
ncbi:MAG: nickel-dependent hydrogenase large subunit [Myxococcales bacterium]|nr:nickel-dependent hydrogenase large subunit [Myxococcales bacterium]